MFKISKTARIILALGWVFLIVAILLGAMVFTTNEMNTSNTSKVLAQNNPPPHSYRLFLPFIVKNGSTTEYNPTETSMPYLVVLDAESSPDFQEQLAHTFNQVEALLKRCNYPVTVIQVNNGVVQTPEERAEYSYDVSLMLSLGYYTTTEGLGAEAITGTMVMPVFYENFVPSGTLTVTVPNPASIPPSGTVVLTISYTADLSWTHLITLDIPLVQNFSPAGVITQTLPFAVSLPPDVFTVTIPYTITQIVDYTDAMTATFTIVLPRSGVWYPVGNSLDSIDKQFTQRLIKNITDTAGLRYTQAISLPSVGWPMPELVTPSVVYADLRIGLFGRDIGKLQEDLEINTMVTAPDSYYHLGTTNFAFPIYQAIVEQLDLQDCGQVCWPNEAWGLTNPSRIKPADKASLPDNFYKSSWFFKPIDIESKNSEDIYKAYQQIRGEYTTTYALQQGVVINQTKFLPLTSTLYALDTTWVSGTLKVAKSEIVTTTNSDVVLAAKQAINSSDHLILRPISRHFLWDILPVSTGVEDLEEGDARDAMRPGSCQALSYMYAGLVSEKYKVTDFLTVTSPITPYLYSTCPAYMDQLQDDPLASSPFSAYLDYYQMIQIYYPGQKIQATEFFNQVAHLMSNTQTWKQDPWILRLLYRPEAQCTPIGHAVLPYHIEPRTITNTQTLLVYDPNTPKENYIPVTLDWNTGVWTYTFNPKSPTGIWTGTMVNYLPFSELPEYGTTITDITGSGNIFVHDGAVEYGAFGDSGITKLSYGKARISIGAAATFGWRSASFGWRSASFGTGIFDDMCIENASTDEYNHSIINRLEGKEQIFSVRQGDYIFTFGKPVTGNVVAGTFYATNALYTFNGTAPSDVLHHVEFNGDLSVITHSLSLSTTTPITDFLATTEPISAQALSLAMYRETDEWTRVFGISHIGLAANHGNTKPAEITEHIVVRTAENANYFELINDGYFTKTYDLSLSQIGRTGVSSFTYAALSIGAGARHIVVPWNWDNLATTLIHVYVDEDNDGDIDTTLTVSTPSNEGTYVLVDTPPTDLAIVGPSYIVTGTKAYQVADEGMIKTITEATYIVADETALNFAIASPTCGVGKTQYACEYAGTAWPLPRWMTYTTPFTVAARHGNTLIMRFHTVDRARNREVPRIRVIEVYTETPHTTWALNDSHATYFTSSVMITLQGNSYLSRTLGAPHRVEYRLDSGRWIQYLKPFTVTESKHYILNFRTVDAAGYAEMVRTVTFDVNKEVVTFMNVGVQQPRSRDMWIAMFRHWMRGEDVHVLNTTTSIYQAGTVVIDSAVAGNFGKIITSTDNIVLPDALTVASPHIAILQNSNLGEYAQFAALFSNYLGRSSYFTPLPVASITPENLATVDILIVPAAYNQEAYAAFWQALAGRQDVIAQFVQNGGTLLAFSYATRLAQDLELVEAGTVSPVFFVDSPNGQGTLNINTPDSLLTYGWMTNTMTVLDDPVLTATGQLATIAVYKDTSWPGSAAILDGRAGNGRVVLIGGHPILQNSGIHYPVIFDTLLSVKAQRARLYQTAIQVFGGLVSQDTIPANEVVPISYTLAFVNYAPYPLNNVTIIQRVPLGLDVDESSIYPSSGVLSSDTQDTTITWFITSVVTQSQMTYMAYTQRNTFDQGEVIVGEGAATYLDPSTGKTFTTSRSRSVMYAELPPDLKAYYGLERDVIYGFGEEGYRSEVYMSLANMMNTASHNIVITHTIPLISIIADIENTNTPYFDPDALTRTLLLAKNEVFFFDNEDYPLPRGVHNHQQVLGVAAWDGKTFYTQTLALGITETVALPSFGDACSPIPYTAGLELLPLSDPILRHVKIVTDTEGHIQIVMPALKLVWEYGSLLAYDYQTPALFYGLHSQEFGERALTFAGRGIQHPHALRLPGRGASVLTFLGETTSPRFSSLVFQEWVTPTIQLAPDDVSRYSFNDAWSRAQLVTLTADSYIILPEYVWDDTASALPMEANPTIQLYEYHDGERTAVPIWDTHIATATADIKIGIAASGEFTDSYNATLLIPIFRGLGYKVAPANGTWQDSIVKPDHVTLLSPVTIGMHDYVRLAHVEAGDRITVSVLISHYAGGHFEGEMLLSTGTRLFYDSILMNTSSWYLLGSSPIIPQALALDVTMTKEVYPTQAHIYSDTLWSIYTLVDKYDPRPSTADVYIQTVGLRNGALTANTKSGLRELDTVYPARVDAGEMTMARVEIINGSPETCDLVALEASAPDFITVSPTTYGTYPAPLWYEQAAFNRRTLKPYERSVWYYDVTVSEAMPETQWGMRHEIPLIAHLVCAETPYTYSLPSIMVGVIGPNGVKVINGAADIQWFIESIPVHILPQAVGMANEEQSIAVGEAARRQTQGGNPDAIFHTLPAVPYTFAQRELAITVPTLANQLPRQDGSGLYDTLYLVVKSAITATTPGWVSTGRNLKVTLRDFNDQVSSVSAASRSVEVVGAALHWDMSRPRIIADEAYQCKLVANRRNDLTIFISVDNVGNRVVTAMELTTTVPTSVTFSMTPASNVTITDQTLIWQPEALLSPGHTHSLAIQLSITPTLESIGQSITVVNGIEAHFMNVLTYPYEPFPEHVTVTTGIALPVMDVPEWPGQGCYE